MEVWAIIISVIMGGLAAGYYFGGFLTQKLSRLPFVIYIMIAVAGLWTGLSSLLIGPISSFTSLSLDLIKFSLSFRTFIVVFCLFFVPVFLLGSIYPLIISLLPEKKSGSASGIIFALSTVGSIAGSLLTPFLFIPVFGTRTTFFLTAGILELIAFFGLANIFKVIPTAVLILFFILSSTMTKQTSSDRHNVVYQTESVFQQIKVLKNGDGYTLSLGDWNDGYISSVYSPGTYITHQYYDYFSLLPLIHNGNKNLNILIIGLGAGTMSRQLSHFYRNTGISIDGVEVDGEVIRVARKYFALDQPGLTVYQMDGRTFLSQTDKKYDIIIVDVYARQDYVPYHLATKEFISLANNHLRKNGIIAYNVSASDIQQYRLQAIASTMRSVIADTYIFTPGNSTEHLVLACSEVLDTSFENALEVAPTEIQQAVTIMKNEGITHFDMTDPKLILTDDTAPEII